MRAVLLSLVLASALTPGCATTTYRSRMWSEPGAEPGWQRSGHVAWIRETVADTHGNPGAGATAGAVVGGLLGGAVTGRGLGALIGAVGGAAVGAGASQDHREAVSYDVMVRFDDGRERVFRYRGVPPFQPGQAVVLTGAGLFAAGAQPAAPAHASRTPEPSNPPPAPPAAVPAPPSSPPATSPAPVAGQPAAPDGEWVGTQQYGWVWMPYDTSYTSVDEVSGPLAYVYYPSLGWEWVAAPWVWGYGPDPWFGVRGGVAFGWYGYGRGHGGMHHGMRGGGGRR